MRGVLSTERISKGREQNVLGTGCGEPGVSSRGPRQGDIFKGKVKFTWDILKNLLATGPAARAASLPEEGSVWPNGPIDALSV